MVLSEKIVLQVPMERQLHDKLQKQAKAMGFNNAQGYIRFWATAETNGPINRGGISIYQDLSSAKAQALRYVELLLAFHKEDFYNLKLAMQYVMRQDRRIGIDKMVKDMLKVEAKERAEERKAKKSS